MRCLTLAELLKNDGHQITFLCRILDGNIISIIEEKQFKVIHLEAPATELNSNNIHDSWLGVETTFEIMEVTKALESFKPDWMIVDHYGLNTDWELHFINIGIKIFVIDDIYRPHYCNGLLDQNAATNKKYPILNPASQFLGPEYALLAKPFYNTKPRVRKGMVKKVLVFFGGTDPTGETLRFVNLCHQISNSIEFDVIVGKNNPQLDQIRISSLERENIHLHIQTQEMPKLMSKADLYIGAGGSTTWERCYLGLPAICIAIAENQEQIAENLHTSKVHHYLGKYSEIDDSKYINSILNIIKNEEIRHEFSKSSLDLNVGSKTQKLLTIFH